LGYAFRSVQLTGVYAFTEARIVNMENQSEKNYSPTKT
jgi:hypothetical protein